MKFVCGSLLIIFALCLTRCSDAGTAPTLRFPQGFHEAGQDSDHSYVSLKTTRLANGNLLLEVTGWGYYETGLFLSCEKEHQSLVLRVTGMCGAVPTFTWTKVTFHHTLSVSDEESISTIRVGRVGTEIVLQKR